MDALRDGGTGGLLFAGHIANWEIAPMSATQRGVRPLIVYRAPNNPRVARLIHEMRLPVGSALFPKGVSGLRRAVAAVARGGFLGVLADQKYNEGIPVPFFGRDAMTSPVLAELALRYHLPLLPVRVERIAGARFRVAIEPPVALPDSGDRARDVYALTTQINAILERWIRERPEQWMWPHRRWPKESRP